MAQQPDEKQKTTRSLRELFPYFAAAFISYWLSRLYRYHLSARLFTSAALTQPEIIGVVAPFSYRIAAWMIVGLALFLFPFLFVNGFKKKPSKRLWLIAVVLAIPQLHGKTCLYEDSLLVTTTPFGAVRCEHTLEDVRFAEIEVHGSSKLRRSPRIPANLTMTLHIPCGEGEDVFTFSVESFQGEEENDRLVQMVRVRRQLPASVIAVEPYTERALRQVIADEGLNDVNPALITELLKKPQ